MLGICFKAYGLGSRSRDREAPALRSHRRFSSYTMRVQTGCSRAEAFVPVGYSWGERLDTVGSGVLRNFFCCVWAGWGLQTAGGCACGGCVFMRASRTPQRACAPGWGAQAPLGRSARAPGLEASGLVGAEKRVSPCGPVSRGWLVRETVQPGRGWRARAEASRRLLLLLLVESS